MSRIARQFVVVLATLTALAAPATVARAADDQVETRLATSVDLMPHYGVSAPNVPNVFSLSVRVSQMVAPPFSGTITVRSAGGILAVVAVTPYGTATAPITLSSPGEHLVTADYSGDDIYLPGTGTITQRVISNDALSDVPRPAPPPAPPVPGAPGEPAPEPPQPAAQEPAPVPAVARVPKHEVRAGVREVTGFVLARRAVTFAQRIAAPGTITWTVEARAGGTLVLATGTREVGVGTAVATLPVVSAGRAHLRRHPNARIVVRTELALDDGRSLRSARRVHPAGARAGAAARPAR